MQSDKTRQHKLQAVVIGSGFGGAVMCCRLAQKWPGMVLMLERGKRYPKGSFPRSPHDFAKNFWAAPQPNTTGEQLNGLFDIRTFSKMDSVATSGYGGGSLTYANVFLQPPDWVFAQGWPAGLDNRVLTPYFQVTKSVLGAKPIPTWETSPARRVQRTELFARFAQAQGRESKLADICVFFGNEYGKPNATDAQPLPMGEQQTNRYGATQTSCTYCGECDVGCNLHAKNTLDLNYLYAAEHWHGAQVLTQSWAEKVVPLNSQGQEDSTATGLNGYRVFYRNTQGQTHHVDAQRVVFSAGTLGTNELLLRCRDEFGSLPRLSKQLGRRFSGNGDFVSLVVQGKEVVDPNFGPVITQYVDHDYLSGDGNKPAFLLEDAAYPAFLSWYVEGLRPLINPTSVFAKLRLAYRVFKSRISQIFRKRSGAVGEYASAMLTGDMSYRSSVLLCMGKDKGDGVFSLQGGQLHLDWPQKSSQALYDAIMACGKRFKAFVGSKTYFTQPNYWWPLRHNITVHPLGGCALASTPEQGVVSAEVTTRGQLFGYQGLYVADGSLIPGSLGANPSATIAALAEWIAEGITGNAPTDTLGKP